jgi:hypothetical protein
MTRHLVVCGVVAALVASGCGSDDPAAPLEVACSISFTGASTQTVACTSQIAANYTAANDTSIVSGGSGISPTAALASQIKFKGVPAPGTYRHSDVGARGWVSTTINGAQGYMASTTGFAGNPVTGSWTLTITFATDTALANGVTAYKIHGTINAVMNPIGGGANPLTAIATF